MDNELASDPKQGCDDDDDDDDDSTSCGESGYESDYDDPIKKENLDKIKNRAIDRDIDNYVLYWLDVISQRNLPGCVIMPVVVRSDKLGDEEMKYRCDMLKKRLAHHQKLISRKIQIVFGSRDEVPTVSPTAESGMGELRHALLDISSINASVFEGHFKPVLSPVILSAQEAILLFRTKAYKAVRFDDIIVEISKRPPAVENFSPRLVQDALAFLSSTGDIVYFGNQATSCTSPGDLAQFVVLDPQWMSSAISSVLSKAKSREISHMSIESFASTGTYFDCPIVANSDTILIWENTEYVRVVSESGSQDLFFFLQQVCEHFGLFIPITIDQPSRTSYLLPSLTPGAPADIWMYKSKESYKTVLCHSWLFRESLHIGLMDQISAVVLKQLMNLAEQSRPESRMSIIQVMCYKTAIYAKVVEQVHLPDGSPVSNIAEFFVRLSHSDSSNCVGSNRMHGAGRKLIVCGKGLVGNHAEKIWKLGYSSILKSIEITVRDYTTETTVLREIACPDCLLMTSPADACVWTAENVAHHGDDAVVCENAHRSSPCLLLGEHIDDDDDCSIATGMYTAYTAISNTTAMTYLTCDTNEKTPRRRVPQILPSVVLVGLWDKEKGSIQNLGSGFIADEGRGLIVTAGHIFYDLQVDSKIGKAYYGIAGELNLVWLGLLGPSCFC